MPSKQVLNLTGRLISWIKLLEDTLWEKIVGLFIQMHGYGTHKFFATSSTWHFPLLAYQLCIQMSWLLPFYSGCLWRHLKVLYHLMILRREKLGSSVVVYINCSFCYWFYWFLLLHGRRLLIVHHEYCNIYVPVSLHIWTLWFNLLAQSHLLAKLDGLAFDIYHVT